MLELEHLGLRAGPPQLQRTDPGLLRRPLQQHLLAVLPSFRWRLLRKVGPADRASTLGLRAGTVGRAHDRSVGRFRSELDEEQLADVEREAGPLLRELGYGD